MRFVLVSLASSHPKRPSFSKGLTSMTSQRRDTALSQMALMQMMLSAHRLQVSPTAHGLEVALASGSSIDLMLKDSPNGPHWSARSDQHVIYNPTTQDNWDVPKDIAAVWAAEAVARYAAEAERGTDLTRLSEGSLRQVLERALAAHGIPSAEHGGSTPTVGALLAKLPDGNEVVIGDEEYGTTAIPAADYTRFGALYRRVKDLPEHMDAPEKEIPLAATGSLWGDIAALVHAIEELRAASMQRPATVIVVTADYLHESLLELNAQGTVLWHDRNGGEVVLQLPS